jgi:predicted transcriptional regulator YdeE
MFQLPMIFDHSLVVQAPVQTCFDLVKNFNEWPKWSPWLILEPDCGVQVFGNAGDPGHRQSWSGKKIGTGETVLREMVPNRSLKFDLTFLKPWKASNKTWFSFEAQGENTTKITWGMEGSIPVFLFFLRKLMIGLIGSDYMRGLRMLQDQAEGKGTLTKLRWVGLEEKPAFHFLALERSCHITEISKYASDDFNRVMEWIGQSGAQVTGKCRTFCPKFDFATGECVYWAGCEVAAVPSSLPVGLTGHSFPAHKALVVEHFGPYRHIGSAWSMAMNRQRIDKFKESKKIPGYETYFTMPGEVAESEILTTVSIPVR